MSILDLIAKIKRRIRFEIVVFFRKKSYYPLIYQSYWHFKLSNKTHTAYAINYYTAIPNPGAGIGHQMANWIAGYWFANKFGLRFAHIPFSNSKWEFFLGFGQDEILVSDLTKKGYKKKRLPLFDEFNEKEVALIRAIIKSYSNKKVVFVAEQDQFYKNQFGVMKDIKKKFYSAPERENDSLVYTKENFNIAIHVRRGDIVIGQENQNPNLVLRWQANDYFEKVLRTVLENVKTDKNVAIYLFSQGKKNDFPEFVSFKNLHFCLEMNAQNSFLHMVKADLLITSKSSFSYKPALLSNGIKVCPKDFWHGYPITEDWILADNQGIFDTTQLKFIKSE